MTQEDKAIGEPSPLAEAGYVPLQYKISLGWISGIWLSFATIGLIWQILEWCLLSEDGLLNFTRPTFILGVVYVFAYGLGWLALRAKRPLDRASMLRMSAGLAAVTLIVNALYSFGEYEHLAIVSRHYGGRDSPLVLSLRGTVLFAQYLQRVVLPVAVYFLLGNHVRRYSK